MHWSLVLLSFVSLLHIIPLTKAYGDFSVRGRVTLASWYDLSYCQYKDKTERVYHTENQCDVRWNAKKNLELFLPKRNSVVDISHLQYFPRFDISSFSAASQKGIVFELEEKNIFISCP